MVRPWRIDRVSLIGLVACLQALVPEAGGYFGLASLKDELITVALEEEDNYLTGRELVTGDNRLQALCDTLLTTDTQKKMCRNQGIAQILVEAAKLSVLECQKQFRLSRWNCSMAGKHRINTLNKGFKETAFMYSVSSAGLVHAFARGCSGGKLDRCSCDDSYSPSKNKQTWMWGGCGDNIRYARKSTKRFLRSQKSQDLRAQVDRHNTNVGILEVSKGISKKCKCHGVSGSCTVKTCWRQLSKFGEIGAKLKRRSERAVKVNSAENTPKAKIQAVRKRRKNKKSFRPKPRKRDLVYMENGETFCEKSDYSFGTVGRNCKRESGNCKDMCCGRGYNTLTRTVMKPCECKVIWCCDVICNTCTITEDYYICK